MDGDDGNTSMWTHLMSLNCTFSGYDGKFCYVFYHEKGIQENIPEIEGLNQDTEWIQGTGKN